MNSIWNNNLHAFKKRFSQLAEMYEDVIAQITECYESISPNVQTETEDWNTYVGGKFCDIWKIERAKNGEVTATENGVRLHSAYNPSREAAQAVLSASDNTNLNVGEGNASLDKGASYGIFCGFGLGYIVIEFAKRFPSGAILAIEPDPIHFFLSMTLIDWTPVFSVEKCIIAISCPVDQIIPLSESFGIPLDKAKVFFNPAFVKHSDDYFLAVKKLINRNLNKINLNENTKKRFGKLWERNARLNLKWAEKCDGVFIYKGAAEKFSLSASDRTSLESSSSSSDRQTRGVPPFLLIAAGPSLEKMLPRLSELKSKMITVCVDTALKAVLRAGVEPDFIVLTDPQFWAYMHIAGLKSPSSVLICDAVSYPAVFRFPCKKIVISSSPFPLPDEYKSAYADKGDLGSGGSVATVAWNFCEYCGAKEIYTVGLDLSFPQKQTHIKGSTFEEAVHTSSKRNLTAEKRIADVLFGADVCKAADYNGNEVLTDSRMKMFAWWFESRIAACPHVKTYTLCAESMVIPGIELHECYQL